MLSDWTILILILISSCHLCFQPAQYIHFHQFQCLILLDIERFREVLEVVVDGDYCGGGDHGDTPSGLLKFGLCTTRSFKSLISFRFSEGIASRNSSNFPNSIRIVSFHPVNRNSHTWFGSLIVLHLLLPEFHQIDISSEMHKDRKISYSSSR